MENPYQSPVESSGPLGEPLPIGAYARQPGLVRHVRIVAVLMIIQGVLESVVGVVVGAMAFYLPLIVTRHQPETPPPQHLFWTVTVVYGVIAIIMMTAAGLHILAGQQNYHFRGRTLGIVAMATGMATLFTCYCLPTAVGIGVYGLIVFLNDEVAEAFRMGEARHKAKDILAAFNPNVVLSSPFAPSPPAPLPTKDEGNESAPLSQMDKSSINKETET